MGHVVTPMQIEHALLSPPSKKGKDLSSTACPLFDKNVLQPKYSETSFPGGCLPVDAVVAVVVAEKTRGCFGGGVEVEMVLVISCMVQLKR